MKFKKFIDSHPFLLIYVAIALLFPLFQIAFFPWFLVMTLAYGIFLYFVKFGTALGWTGYLLDGISKSKKHHSKLAIRMYKGAWEHNSHCVPGLIAYSLYNLKNYQYPLALEILQKTVALPKINPVFLKYAELDLGIAWWKNGRLDKAIEQLEEMAAKYEYFSEEFNTTLGYFYCEAGDFAKAAEYTDKALHENENSAAGYDNLGQIAYRSGDYDEAEKMFLRALRIKDTLADSKYYLGMIYESRENYEEAAQYFLLAHKSPLTGMNTIAPETIEEKYQEYFGEIPESPEEALPAETAANTGKSEKGTVKKIKRTDDTDLDDIEQEF